MPFFLPANALNSLKPTGHSWSQTMLSSAGQICEAEIPFWFCSRVDWPWNRNCCVLIYLSRLGLSIHQISTLVVRKWLTGFWSPKCGRILGFSGGSRQAGHAANNTTDASSQMELWSYTEFSFSKSVPKCSQGWYGLWGSLFFLVTMELLVSIFATRASRGLGKKSECQNPLAVFGEAEERVAGSSKPEPMAANNWPRCCFLAVLFGFFESKQIKTNGEKRQNFFFMDLSGIKWMELAG